MLGTTVTLTAGFVSWILRGSALLNSFLLSVPLLKRFDPVPILKTTKKKAKTVGHSPVNNETEHDKDELFEKNDS